MNGFYQAHARQKIKSIRKKWKSPAYRAQKALWEADFYIGMLNWVTDETAIDLRTAIEVYRQFIDSL